MQRAQIFYILVLSFLRVLRVLRGSRFTYRMIAIDWGTSSFRAYLLHADGRVLEKRSAPLGILNVEQGKFADALEGQIGDWLNAGAAPVLMSGMVGSRQGWVEATYANCPAGAKEIAAGMREVSWSRHRAWIVPGLSTRDSSGTPDVMRGEETQIIGAMDRLPPAGSWVCLPGTHSKWVEVREGRILRFSTHMTGEVFAVMKAHSILGRMMTDGPTDPAWFEAGVRRAQDAGGLLHHLFGVRARGLFGEIPNESAASYLSGILIGDELASIGNVHGSVYLLGDPSLVALYQRALESLSRATVVLDSDAAVRGLFTLAQHLPRS
jgi:2-dehydro-3-deoxygalactonokinase